MLAGAEEVPGAPELQILLGDDKAVGGGAQGLQPLPGALRPVVGQQDAVGLVLPSAHPAPELVELAEAEAVRVLDDHEGGVGHVHPHLDDGGGHQHVQLPPGEGGHDSAFLPGLLLSVDDAHPEVREDLGLQGVAVLLRGLHALGVGLVHGGADDVHLPPLAHLLPDEAVEPLALVLPDEEGLHRGPARGELVDHRQVQVPVDHQGQGPGDGGGGHDQHVGPPGSPALGGEGRPLVHAEAVLLVGDHQAQAGKVHRVGQQGVGAHDEVGLPPLQSAPAGPLLGGGHGPGEEVHRHAQGGEQVGEGPGVLLGQELRGGHQGGLTAVLLCQPGAGGGHHGLAGAHVPLEEAVHGHGLSQIGGGLLHGPPLGPGEGEGEGRGEGVDVLLCKGGGKLGPPPAPEEGQAQGEAEELLEHQPPPGPGQGLPVRGEVDLPIGEGGGGQVVGPAEVVGQGL